MRKPNLASLKLPVLLITILLMVASCARSPYNFVKVQPKKPVDRVAPAAVSSPGSQTVASSAVHWQAPQAAFKTPAIKSRSVKETQMAPALEMEHATASEKTYTRKDKRQQARKQKEQTRKVVRRELKNSSAFGALSAKQLEKVEKIISKQTSRIAEKKAASPASAIGFNQWMKIGVILLLIGLVVGIAFADLGYLVAVIGVVFLVLGLIQQL